MIKGREKLDFPVAVAEEHRDNILNRQTQESHLKQPFCSLIYEII
jgi:hypothetical protein